MCVSVTFPSNLLFKLSLLHKKTFGIQQLNRYLSVKRLKYCQKRKPCLCYNVIKHCSKRSTHVFWRQPLPAALPIVGNDKWLLGLGWSRLHVTSEFDPISDEVTLTCLHTMSCTSKVMTSDLTLQQRPLFLFSARHVAVWRDARWQRMDISSCCCCCSLIELSRDNYISDVTLWCCRLYCIYSKTRLTTPIY